MGNIVLLDDLTINKIAAGEVIERPASVVKEVVENSIDAGADKITVEIKNGGISFIRVSDNGKGIKEDDMEIAFERHATSKIRTADDILKVTSMGFRGEALASIAAIARVEMVSKTEENAIGTRIVVEGGDVIDKSVIGAPRGTTLTITNLFYNTPVRYKFLKKDFTEAGYIEDIITRLALVNKNISFKLISNGKTVIQTNGDGKISSVIYSIYGKDIASSVADVEYELEGIKVSGVIGNSDIARANRSQQLFFVNGRYIRDKVLTSAADQSFKGAIPVNKYGFLILNLEMDPSFIDVNVHPAKLEVRFEDENKVFKAVYHAIKAGLEKVSSLPKKNVQESISTEDILRKESDKIETVEENKEEVKFEPNENIENHRFEKGHRFKNFFNRKEENKKAEESEFEPEEKGENRLEEIYKFRNGLKKLGISEVSQPTTFNIEESLKEKELEENKEQYDSVETKSNDIAEANEETEDTATPSYEIVSKMTERILHNTMKKEEKTPEEVAEKEVEELLKEDSASGVQEDFGNMYKKLFGESSVKIDETLPEKELTENERKILEEIKRAAIEGEVPKEEVENKEENTENVEDENNEEVAKEEQESGEVPKLEIKDILLDNEHEEKLPEFQNIDTSNYRILGTVFNTYIIVELSDEMYVVDKYLAKEKAIYENVKNNYFSTTNKDSQTMLMPDVISLNHNDAEKVKEFLNIFENAGFELEAFGENTLKLTAVPDSCMDMDTKKLFLELLDELKSMTANQDKEMKFIEILAGKIASKSENSFYDERENKKIIDTLMSMDKPFEYVNGNSIAVKYTKYDLERKFSRK